MCGMKFMIHMSHIYSILVPTLSFAGTAVAQWLRCCATNRKVAGSIPSCVIGFSLT